MAFESTARPSLERMIAAAESLSDDIDRVSQQIEALIEPATKDPEASTQALTLQIKDLEREIQEREAEITAEVSMETKGDLTSALRFTNETARKAETKSRIGKDARIKEARFELDRLSNLRFNAQLEQSQAEHRMKALVAVKDLKVAKAGLYQAIILRMRNDE